MRFVTKSGADLHLAAVSFGCDIECPHGTCKEYEGSVPTGYASLEAWYAEECERLYRWKVSNSRDGGSLTLDETAQEPTYTDTSQLDAVYPVGSVYLTTSTEDPVGTLGGKWTQLLDIFPEPLYAWERIAAEIFFAEKETIEKNGNLNVTWINYASLWGYDTAHVVFDGVAYECPITWTDDGFERGFYIGNALGLAPEYPFGFLGYEGLNFTAMYADDGTHTISFSVIL